MSDSTVSDETLNQLAQECPFWGVEDWRRFLALSKDDQALTAQAFHQASIAAGVDYKAVALKILNAFLTVASGVSTVAGAAGGVAGAIQALEAL
jgi:hypothetical protein